MPLLPSLISQGETSTLQFKEQVTNCDALAAEMAAMSNFHGGKILVGVSDDGQTPGIPQEQLRVLNGWISSGSQQNIQPPILPQTNTIPVGDGRVVVIIDIPPSDNKPHFDKNGIIWIKAGADKRKVGSREECRRLFQDSTLIHADEVVVASATVADISEPNLRRLLGAESGAEQVDPIQRERTLPALLENLGLARDGKPNIAGLLLAGDRPQRRIPLFMVKAVAFEGCSAAGTRYHDSEDIGGTLAEMYESALAFIGRQMRKIQGAQDFNSVGQWEVPKEVFGELLANALLHRDYFISAPIRVFVFDDRVEIISPGVLPNNLTLEKIRLGNSNMRNPVLASFGTFVMPYRGIGTGIRRALELWPDLEFVNSHDLNAFQCVIGRKRA